MFKRACIVGCVLVGCHYGYRQLTPFKESIWIDKKYRSTNMLTSDKIVWDHKTYKVDKDIWNIVEENRHYRVEGYGLYCDKHITDAKRIYFSDFVKDKIDISTHNIPE